MGQRLIDIVKEMYAAMPSLDWATYESHLHPDFRIVEADSLPFSGTFRGMAGMQQLVATIFEVLSEFEAVPVKYCASDDTVMVWVDMKMTARESGKTIKTQMIEVFTFEGEKLVEICPFYYDTDLINSVFP